MSELQVERNKKPTRREARSGPIPGGGPGGNPGSRPATPPLALPPSGEPSHRGQPALGLARRDPGVNPLGRRAAQVRAPELYIKIGAWKLWLELNQDAIDRSRAVRGRMADAADGGGNLLRVVSGTARPGHVRRM